MCSNRLYALYSNGTEKWNYTPKNGKGIGTTAAIGNDGTIYIGTFSSNYAINSTLCALNPDGRLKWNSTVGSMIISTPEIGGDGTIYLGTMDGHFYAVYPNGTQRWNFTVNNIIISSPAIGTDGTIYFGCEDNNVYALNPDGTLKWKYFIYNGTQPFLISSPTIGSDGTIYVGSTDGCLYALNPDSTLKWKYQTGHFIDSSPAIGSDGTLYIGSEDSTLYAIQDKHITPSVSSNIKSGYYNTTKTVKLTLNENGTIYYTLNGKTPTTSSNVYKGPLTIMSTSILKYFAVDLAGNRSQVYTNTYTIDKTAPKVKTINPSNNAKGVTLTTPITIKFSEKTSKGTNFTAIYIKNMSTGKITHTTVTISGNTLTIKMIKTRLTRNNYQIYIPKGAVKDLAGNSNSKYISKFRTKA